jgi:cardiolipin synthase
MTIPNLISLGRLLAVPLVIWLLVGDEYRTAFIIFAAAAVSDAIDGYIAKRFRSVSTLGRYLDPLADKALLVAIYLTLGFQGLMPSWLVIMVVSRDVLIIGAVLLSFTLEQPVQIQPLLISKVNTLAQLSLAALILATLGFSLPEWHVLGRTFLVALVAVTTIWSGASYLVGWLRSMGAIGKAT